MKPFRTLLCLFALSAWGVAAPAVWDSSHQTRFVLEDPLDHPFFSWPRTLLRYPLRFAERVVLERLALSNATTGERVPFQFSDVVEDAQGVRSATLNFFADLPQGAHKEFLLSLGSPAKAAGVTESRDGKSIVLDSGVLKVRIPASQMVAGDTPGPIQQVSRAGTGKWIGTSRLTIPDERVTAIEATRLANGPLFVTYRLTYKTAKGAAYVASVTCQDGLDFVRLEEDMEGLSPNAAGSLEMSWDGFAVTHRQSANHPYPFPERLQAGGRYQDYPWESIDERQMNTHLGVQSGLGADGELPFSLGIFQPWPAFRVSNFANFWSEKSGDALGVFIDRVAEWQDHDYAIWRSSPALQVHYAYRDGKLLWKWPVVRGHRSTGLAFYDHARDINAMKQMETTAAGVRAPDGITYRGHLSPTSHVMLLQNRYGTLDLNMVKDWMLGYPESARQAKVIFANGPQKRVADLERSVLASSLTCELALSGTRQNGGFGPVPSRQILDGWVDAYNRLAPEMTRRQRKRITAVYLLMAYTHAAEDYMPMLPMLSGHPNFLSDVKSVPGAMAFLFPEHPMASTWADEWEKFVELNTRYHTRPAVETWGALGGRWTENLGTYVWGFVRPAARAGFALRNRDGYERFVSPELAQVGDWLVDSLSAPFAGESKEALALEDLQRDAHEWGVVTPELGPRRVFPPQGAHAERRKTPRSMWYLGFSLQNFAPLTAEHLMWAARPSDQDQEILPGRTDPWDVMYAPADNRGTNPHLRSAKYTGTGIVLRAAVDTPNEISLHIGQIDEGPNYRWGVAGEGGSGVLYFYAGGKGYSHNAGEDVGDRFAQDTDFGTTFGVWKGNHFRSIGQNVLSRPLYDLDGAQFAELVPRTGPSAYSWPEYVSRSILLAGHDYFVLYDDVANQAVGHRLSWFVRRGDEFPSITLIRGAERKLESQVTEVQTRTTLGKWFDGLGDSMAVVSARKDLQSASTPFGCTVKGPGVDDLVFRDPAGIKYDAGGIAFEGTAGLVRRRGGTWEAAIFHGTRLAIPGLTLLPESSDLGIAATLAPDGTIAGRYFAPTTSKLRVAVMTAGNFYIDGEAQAAAINGAEFVVEMKAGLHRWEISGQVPTPLPPEIEHTENVAGGARVVARPVAGATQYSFEISRDNGSSWVAAGSSPRPEFSVHDLANGIKVHIRAIASNADRRSDAGAEYPLYVSDRPPAAPDGVRVQLSDGAASLSWGEVLGAGEYRLYRRSGEQEPLQLIYHGSERTYVDRNPAIGRADAVPGQTHAGGLPLVYQYCVKSVNGNGESAASRFADTDPASWRNWDPMPGEAFRRSGYATRTEPGQESLPRYYPR